MKNTVTGQKNLETFAVEDFKEDKIYELGDKTFAIYNQSRQKWLWVVIKDVRLEIEDLDDSWTGEYPVFHGEIRLTSG